jgi:hypothetical protein
MWCLLYRPGATFTNDLFPLSHSCNSLVHGVSGDRSTHVKQQRAHPHFSVSAGILTAQSETIDQRWPRFYPDIIWNWSKYPELPVQRAAFVSLNLLLQIIWSKKLVLTIHRLDHLRSQSFSNLIADSHSLIPLPVFTTHLIVVKIAFAYKTHGYVMDSQSVRSTNWKKRPPTYRQNLIFCRPSEAWWESVRCATKKVNDFGNWECA